METTKKKPKILAIARKKEYVEIVVHKPQHDPFAMVITYLETNKKPKIILFDTQKEISSYIEEKFKIYLIK